MTDFADEIRDLVETHTQTIIKEAGMIMEETQQPCPDLIYLAQATHKIKGSSGTVGFMELFEAAANLNQSLNQLAVCNARFDDEARELFAEFERLSSDLRPNQSNLWKTYVAQLAS